MRPFEQVLLLCCLVKARCFVFPRQCPRWKMQVPILKEQHKSRLFRAKNGRAGRGFSRQLSAGPKPETANDELSSSSSSSKNKKQSSRHSSPTHRSAAIFALMEGGKRQPTFAVRRLENDPDYLALEQRDRSFARLLITTTERRMGQIDLVLEEFMTKSSQFRKVRTPSPPSKNG
jgi:hypothetical protein